MGGNEMTEYLSSCLHTLLVIGLPASGKLRARKRLKELNDPVRFHISDTIVQLNDSPYILLMRWIDKVLVKMGLEPVFFRGPGENFQDPRSWEALIHLLNQDYANLLAGTHLDLEAFEDSATVYMLHRLEQAHKLADMSPVFEYMDKELLQDLLDALEEECSRMVQYQEELLEVDLSKATIVIELVRGGPEESELPLDPPYGNRHAFTKLSNEILENSHILWIKVSPEESNRQNVARAVPDPEDSIAEVVMLEAYGTCDFQHMLDQSTRGPDTVIVEAHGYIYALAVGTFDNGNDLTSCLQEEDPAKRDPEKMAILDTELKQAMNTIWTTLSRLEDESRE